MPCYCIKNAEYEILDDIESDSVPDEALENDCCWREICRVRGRHFSEVDDETWRSICRRRGYVKRF